MDDRAGFEAWAMQFNPQLLINFGRGPTVHNQIAYAAWQAATLRQQERIAELEAQVQALSVDAERQPPADWSVFNSGAEVATGITWDDARSYLTPARLERGWGAVLVVDKMNFDVAVAAGKGEA